MKSSIPKVLHKLFGKTLLQRVISTVLSAPAINEIFVVVGHQADKIKDSINSSYHDIHTVLQEPQLGTGDAVFKVYDKLESFSGTVIVLCGDTPLITGETLGRLIEFHKNSRADLTLLSAIFENPCGYGRILRDESENVTGIVEEKDANPQQKGIKEINAGVYCLEWNKISPAFLNLKSDNSQGEYYLTDIVEWAVNNGLKVNADIIGNNLELLGINSRADLAAAMKILNARHIENLMLSGVTIIDPDSSWISPETHIGKDSTVYPNCYFEGENTFGENCVLGPDLFIGGNVNTANDVKIFSSRISNAEILENSAIGPFAHIRDNVKIANNIRIGNFVEIKNSSINEFTNVSHLSYIGDSKLGKNVNIGAGTITANYNPLTREKNKTEIKDGVKIGSNSVLVAPVTISKNANVAAGSVITKDVPEDSLAIARGQQRVIENWVSNKLNKVEKT